MTSRHVYDVAGDFNQALNAILDESDKREHDMYWVDTHPICALFSAKIHALNTIQPLAVPAALILEIEKIAKGE